MEPLRALLTDAGVELRDPTGPAAGRARNAALVYDATGILNSAELRDLYEFFQPRARAVYPSGRVIVLGTTPELCRDPHTATAQQALEGFVRGAGREFGRGVAAQLVYLAPGEHPRGAESTLRFLLSGRSAYMSGQVVRISAVEPVVPDDWSKPLAGKTALVTGATRGIGAAIVRVLARHGADVVAVDRPAAGAALASVVDDIGGTALRLDLSSADAPARLAGHLSARHGPVDIVIHNAGVTQGRTLARTTARMWDNVLDVNLSSQERVNAALLAADLINDGGRLVGVSSIAGGQGRTGYATSQAGVVGLVRATSAALASRGITVNAVVPDLRRPGLTARMPVPLWAAGRGMNSTAHDGLPIDVAETVAWLASPGSAGVTGNVLRVCGRSLLGRAAVG